MFPLFVLVASLLWVHVCLLILLFVMFVNVVVFVHVVLLILCILSLLCSSICPCV